LRTPLLLLALLILGAPAFAEPQVKLVQDRSRDSGADVAPKQWFDLVLMVDPKDAPVLAEGLEATPAPLEGAAFKAAIYPAPDADGTFTKPFVVRVPVMLPAPGKHALAVTLKGKTKDGPFEVTGKTDLRLLDFTPHYNGAAAVKEPAKVDQPNAIVVLITVAETFHVYGAATPSDEGQPLVGMLLPAPGTRGAPPWTGGGPASLPGKKYEGTCTLEIPFTPTRAGKTEMRILLDAQVCDANSCDPNALRYLPLSFDVEGAAGGGEKIGAEPASPNVPRKPAATASKAPASGTSSGGGDDLATKSLWGLIGLAFGAGILALLMPCTYPMIPITISFFTKQADASHKSVVPLAIAYGLGIVAIFTAIGAVVGIFRVASGEDILNFASGWPINLVFAVLFLVFGLSLLGLFDIRLPSFFDDLAAKASGTGGYMSVFAMGLTLVITSFTCTVPFIGSLLILAAKAGHAADAIVSMAVFGLTMAVPFVILALSPKAFQAMPKSGEWMKRLKVTLGIVELGLVLKFVSNVDIATAHFFIGRELFLVLWALSFLAAGLYLLGFFDLFAKGVRWSFGKGRAVAGILMLAMTGVLAYGATGRPVDNVLGSDVGSLVESFLPQFKADYSKAFLAVAHDYDDGVRIATEKGANIFLHFTGYT
jgi:cytochrome c biogenesis protein CcdA